MEKQQKGIFLNLERYYLERSFLPRSTFTGLKCISPIFSFGNSVWLKTCHPHSHSTHSAMVPFLAPPKKQCPSDTCDLIWPEPGRWNDIVDKRLDLDHTTNQEQSDTWNCSHLTASWVRSPDPTPSGLMGGGEWQGEQRTLPACSVPMVTSDLPTLSRHSVHVPSQCQSPRARLEFGTHHGGQCVDFWTCLLLVKQTSLASKIKSRLINNQKSYNSRKISRSFYLEAFNSINVNHPPIPPKRRYVPSITLDH